MAVLRNNPKLFFNFFTVGQTEAGLLFYINVTHLLESSIINSLLLLLQCKNQHYQAVFTWCESFLSENHSRAG